jgi:hypothetical protein
MKGLHVNVGNGVLASERLLGTNDADKRGHMSKQTISQLDRVRTSPCDCGHPDAYWHGPRDGQREYMCKGCWHVRQAVALLKGDYVQRNKHRLGVLGSNDVDAAIVYLQGVESIG